MAANQAEFQGGPTPPAAVVTVVDEDDEDVVPVTANARGPNYKSRSILLREVADLRRELALARQMPQAPVTQPTGMAGTPLASVQMGTTPTATANTTTATTTTSVPTFLTSNWEMTEADFQPQGDPGDEDCFEMVVAREREWGMRMATYRGLPDFAHMTAEDWSRAKMSFMAESAAPTDRAS